MLKVFSPQRRRDAEKRFFLSLRLVTFLYFVLAANLAAQPANQPFFLFDKPDETIKATLLENPNFYDAGIASSKEGLWLAWLEFQPGKGDQLWIGLRGTNGWIQKTNVPAGTYLHLERQRILTTSFQRKTNAGEYATPTVTIDREGKVWLTYEARTRDVTESGETNLYWETMVEKRTPEGEFENHFPQHGINHRIMAGAHRGIWVVTRNRTWGSRGEAFDIGINRTIDKYSYTDYSRYGPIFTQGWEFDSWSDGWEFSPWSPACALNPGNGIHIIWDGYDGTSYNVYSRSVSIDTHTSPPPEPSKWTFGKGKILTIAATPAFEAHAQIASDKNGKLWVSWEEDGENWGQRYVARLGGDKKSTRMTDKVGPLHRYRKLHLAQLDEKNETLSEFEIPQPSFELARSRTDAQADMKNFGAFYENCQLVVDGQNRPWIVYRHFYVPWIGIVPETHKQDNMRLYARCLLTNGWSKLYSFDIGQGDGMQRISVSPEEKGIALAWTTGRTDRRTKDEREKNDKHRGVAIAQIKLEKAEAKVPAKTETRKLNSKDMQVAAKPRQRPSVTFRDKHYELFFGDLHRHTDISLCFSPVDGTIDDAYRYAIDAAPLDFLGITDHTHDLDWGAPLAQIWWRSRKEVDRHALAGRFIPFYSYERSRFDNDHNVISLRDDVLRPHDYPLANFWQELDTNTFTIPHQPFNAITWNYHDDTHRPLMEIYQGFRDASMEKPAAEALARGHHVGFIAASDHLSTDASFSCVWAEKPTRESVFRAMQARRTYAATAKIILKVTCGEHWMGEAFELKKMEGITVKITPTATITGLDLFMDGEVHSSVVDIMQAKPGSETTWEIPAEQGLIGKHTFYVRVTQKDGNHAWSSPMWIDIKR
jgi:hypothetical protein